MWTKRGKRQIISIYEKKCTALKREKKMDMLVFSHIAIRSCLTLWVFQTKGIECMGGDFLYYVVP